MKDCLGRDVSWFSISIKIVLLDNSTARHSVVAAHVPRLLVYNWYISNSYVNHGTHFSNDSSSGTLRDVCCLLRSTAVARLPFFLYSTLKRQLMVCEKAQINTYFLVVVAIFVFI